MDIHRHTGTGTHAQIHMVYTHRHVCTGTYTHRHSLKVSTVKPILSVCLCAPFPTVLVFFTPPVTMCHHLPPQRWSQCYLQTVLRKIQGQKSARGIWTIEQKFDAHTMFDIWIHFCVAQRYILPCKDNHFVLNYLCKCCSFILLTDDDKHNLVACVKKMTYCIVRYNWMYSFHMLPVYHKLFQWL